MANQKVSKPIDKVWAVGTPGDKSELEDIWFDASDFVQNQFREYKPFKFFTDSKESRNEASKRLQERDEKTRR